MDPGCDRITTEVIAHRFAAAADEMMATLVKTAYSPNIKERRDCSVAISRATDRRKRAAGGKWTPRVRVVLDTNVLISALATAAQCWRKTTSRRL